MPPTRHPHASPAWRFYPTPFLARCCNAARASRRRACRLSGPGVISQRYTVVAETPSWAANWATESPCWRRSRATDLPVGRILRAVPVAPLADARIVVGVGGRDG